MKPCCPDPRWRVLLGVTVAVVMAVSWAVDAREAMMSPAEQKAEAAMNDLGQRLRMALTQKMQAEGPVAAVDFCHTEAPRIAAEVAAEHGVKVGRTAVRHRSQANAPSEWQQGVLTSFAEQAVQTAPQELRFVDEREGQLRVAKGIPVQTPCLACHGSNISEPVRAAIDERYPGDTATGFSEGDLRGIFWAEVPMDETGNTP